MNNISDGFDAFKEFVAIRNHFTSDYNYFVYNGKTNVSLTSYNKRRDRYMFDKLAKMREPRKRLIAGMLEDQQWIGDIVGEEGNMAFLKHEKYAQAASHWFKNELQQLPKPLSALVACDDGTPKLAQLYFQNRVSIETLVILNRLIDFISLWKRKISGDPLMEQLIVKVLKYNGFFSCDLPKIQQIYVDFMLNKQ